VVAAARSLEREAKRIPAYSVYRRKRLAKANSEIATSTSTNVKPLCPGTRHGLGVGVGRRSPPGPAADVRVSRFANMPILDYLRRPTYRR
jgi:hypothetical protein